ncbi:hypothetical protein ACVNBO_006833, partial [Pseudomonas aeruginosa]
FSHGVLQMQKSPGNDLGLVIGRTILALCYRFASTLNDGQGDQNVRNRKSVELILWGSSSSRNRVDSRRSTEGWSKWPRGGSNYRHLRPDI